MIDPTKNVPDREVLSLASGIMSDLLAVRFHKVQDPALMFDKDDLNILAQLAYEAAFALLREHLRLAKLAQSKGGKK